MSLDCFRMISRQLKDNKVIHADVQAQRGGWLVCEKPAKINWLLVFAFPVSLPSIRSFHICSQKPGEEKIQKLGDDTKDLF